MTSAGPIGELAAIWRYPVSSTAGERLERGQVDATGLAGDRTHALIDPADGETATPERKRRWHTAPLVRSRVGPGGGVEVAAAQDWLPVDQAGPGLAAAFGFAVVARPYGEGAKARYRRGPLHVLTTSSLRALQALLPDSAIVPARFRPNLLIDTPGLSGFVEQDWLGRVLQVGAVQLRFARPCGRCSFTTLPQDGLGLDRAVLRSLIQAQDRMFGMICEVVQGGAIAEGDAVILGGA